MKTVTLLSLSLLVSTATPKNGVRFTYNRLNRREPLIIGLPQAHLLFVVAASVRRGLLGKRCPRQFQWLHGLGRVPDTLAPRAGIQQTSAVPRHAIARPNAMASCFTGYGCRHRATLDAPKIICEGRSKMK